MSFVFLHDKVGELWSLNITVRENTTTYDSFNFEKPQPN